MSNRTNAPIWADIISTATGVSLQHLVDGSWVDTGMKLMPVPSGYTPEVAINKFAESDLYSTEPDFSPETGITPQLGAYQVYKLGNDEIGFINDWSYETWSGSTKCLSEPINRHADSRQKLVYGNFSEEENSIIVKELVRPVISIEPMSITISADQPNAYFSVTSNVPFYVSTDADWISLTTTAFTSGTTYVNMYASENKDFSDRSATIFLTYESYWEVMTETIVACTLTQKAVVPSYYVSPLEQNVAWDSTGLTYFTVNTNVPFTANTNASWLEYSATTQAGYHAYNVSFNTSANTGDAREAYTNFVFQIDALGNTQTITPIVRQNNAPILTLTPESESVSAEEQNVLVQVYSQAPWNVTDKPQWVTATSSGISGTTVATIGVSDYNSTGNRSGSIVFSNGARTKTFSLTQYEPSFEIDYTSTDENIVTPDRSNDFGATLVSNYYEPSVGGKLVFNSKPIRVPVAYIGKTTLETIHLPDSIAEIQAYAFQNCSQLTTINIPFKVTEIDRVIFSGCTSLTSVDAGTGITKIKEYAFYGCSGLTSISFPAVTEIEQRAFSHCSGLTSINISGVTTIGGEAFSHCGALTSISLPVATTIGGSAFSACSGLTSINIPVATSIGSFAFSSCSGLTSINLPAATTIGSDAFYNCSSLETVIFSTGLTVINADAFQKTHVTSITFPDSLIRIENDAFGTCYYLAEVTFGTGLTKIGDRAFYNCIGLRTINYRGTVSQWNSITKGSNWCYNISTYRVHCSDGNAYTM